jgi:serine/threonine protein phosphatase 1
MDSLLTFAIGDVHGCFDKLRSLLEACEEVRNGRQARYILLGDYIDRGPDSRKVIDLLIERHAGADGRFICLRGNHEQMLIEAADLDRSDRALVNWWGNGGEQTLDSYGVDDPSSLPVIHLEWLKSLPLTVVDPGRLFVHAGIRPGKALGDQSEADLMGIREPFLSFEADHDSFVVHGHTPTKSRLPDLRSNRLNIDTGACFGGELTAATFSGMHVKPLFFVNSHGDVW